MKKYIMLMIFLVSSYLISADTILFKDGNTLSGEILKKTDDSVVIFSPVGIMTIPQNTIDRVVSDKQTNTSTVTNINIVTKDIYKYDPDYRMSNQAFALAVGFFIPGNFLLFGTLAIATPFIYNYYSMPLYASFYKETYDEERQVLIDNYEYVEVPHNMLYAGLYGSLITTGIVLSAISIPFFISSNHYLNKFKKRHNFAMITGFNADSFSFGVAFSL